MSDTNSSTVRVAVTRPVSQGERLSELIEAAGGTAIRIPALEIGAAPQPLQAKTSFEQLDDYDYLVFISPNAVRFSLAYFEAAQLQNQTTVAIGASTANAMEIAGVRCDVYPQHSFTSEALLALPEFAELEGKSILIVRGIGGRELLGREFQNRGATVTYAEVYQRSIPEKSKPLLNEMLQHDAADMVTANSVETLTNVLSITDDQWRDKLLRLQLVTGSSRVVQKAAELGFELPAILAEGPDDHSLMRAISLWSPAQNPATETHDFTENIMTQNTPDPDEHDLNENSDSTTSDDTAGAKGSVDSHLEEAHTPAAAETADTGGMIERSADAPAEIAPAIVKKTAGRVAWLALLLSLLAFVTAGWTWWQSNQMRSTVADVEIPTAAQIRAEVKQDTDRFNGQVTRQLDRQEKELEDAIDQHSTFASSIRTQKRSVETLTGQLAQMEDSISAMSGVSANIRNTWVRAETEYFLQTANTRLQLAGDVNSAIQALHAANERIVALGDPALTPVRAQISEELLALESVPKIDIEGIALSLNSVARGVSKLALKDAAPESLRRAAAGDDQQSGWGRAKGVVSNAFTSIVRVSPADDSHAPLLAPEQAYFLYRNLELQLQGARIAAMQQQQQNYANSVDFALDWLRRYFDPADSGVAVVIQRLEQLRNRPVISELPDISGSLNMLRTLPQGSIGSAAPRAAPVGEDAVDSDAS